MRVLELFAGYGSQALALENLGIEFTSDISEIDRYAIQAYNQLHGETHNWGDITKIDETKLPYYDLITYSSPCQDFSLAGLQRGGDEGSGTRSSLLWECERIIRAVRPKYLLMENVKNLVGEKHKHNFIRWLRVLEMMGYQNFWKVLNAKDYGVPQNRERVFVVSILGCGQYLFPNPIKLEKRLKDVLEPVVDEKYYLSLDKVDKLVMNMDKEVSNTIRCGGGSTDGKHTWDIVAKPLEKAEKHDAAVIQRAHGFNKGNIFDKAPTLTANGKYQDNNYIIQENINLYPNSGNPQAGRVYNTEGISPNIDTCSGGNRMPKTTDQYRIRKLTPRECWRLMGVKDEQYDKLHDISNTQLYKMAGNSIVVNMLMGIFKNLLQSDEGSKGQLLLL